LEKKPLTFFEIARQKKRRPTLSITLIHALNASLQTAATAEMEIFTCFTIQIKLQAGAKREKE